MKIQGKIALVAGGTRGIGLAIASALAAEGARLVIPTHDWPRDVRSVEEKFSGGPAGHICVKADLRDHRDVGDLVEIVGKTFGCLHILVNNIERGGMPIVHGSYDRPVNSEQWQLEMDTTLLAKRHLFENCLPLLKKAEEAVVVNISSIAGIVGRSGPAGLIFSDGYSAANRAVSSLTATWARIGAPGVRVNEIMLGLIDTRHGEKTRGWSSLEEQQRKSLLEHTLLGRTGKPAEVAGAVLFLIRDAGYMTGSVLLLDGGYVLGGDKVPAMPPGEI
jgi:3-oxoacyl-[acyl-carrier protein] reductase